MSFLPGILLCQCLQSFIWVPTTGLRLMLRLSCVTGPLFSCSFCLLASFICFIYRNIILLLIRQDTGGMRLSFCCLLVTVCALVAAAPEMTMEKLQERALCVSAKRLHGGRYGSRLELHTDSHRTGLQRKPLSWPGLLCERNMLIPASPTPVDRINRAMKYLRLTIHVTMTWDSTIWSLEIGVLIGVGQQTGGTTKGRLLVGSCTNKHLGPWTF